jgi:hypothetical protein
VLTSHDLYEINAFRAGHDWLYGVGMSQTDKLEAEFGVDIMSLETTPNMHF